MTEFADRFWTSRDGLKLHFRDYGTPGSKPPIVCLAGLTRNARDFEGVAARLADEWRVICVDLRGRGDSAYAKDPASYNPLQYADDLAQLFAQEEITRAVFFGTSLGGLVTMITALTAPQAIAGVLLNDVGPELDPAGIERIRSYVGQGRNYPTWMHAARALEESQSAAFPGYGVTDWLAMAKRCMMVGSNGRIHFDYDMKIAEPLGDPPPDPPVDMWPAIAALKDVPALLLRGGRSDVLGVDTFARMDAMLPLAEAVTLPDVGHAPTLDEPAAAAAIDRLLARVA